MNAGIIYVLYVCIYIVVALSFAQMMVIGRLLKIFSKWLVTKTKYRMLDFLATPAFAE